MDSASGAVIGECRCTLCNTSLTLDTYDGLIYVAGQVRLEDGGFAEGIVEIDPVDCSEWIVSSGALLGFLQGIAIEADGDILVSDQRCAGCAEQLGANRGGILRIDRQTGAQSILFSGSPVVGPQGLDVAPDGQIYVATQLAPDFLGGVVRIDPDDPAKAEVVAIGDDEEPAIDRRDIINSEDLAIESAAGPVYVFDVRDRGSLQDAVRLLEVDLSAPPSENQRLLTGGMEGIDPERQSGQLRGIDILDGELYVIDYNRRDQDGRVTRFIPGVDDGDASEGTGITPAEAIFRPTGLAIVPAPEPRTALGAASAALTVSIMARLGRRRSGRRRGVWSEVPVRRGILRLARGRGRVQGPGPPRASAGVGQLLRVRRPQRRKRRLDVACLRAPGRG